MCVAADEIRHAVFVEIGGSQTQRLCLILFEHAPQFFRANVRSQQIAPITQIDCGIAATGGMAKLLKENEFATQFHEGEKANIHIQLVGNRVILVVIFDAKSSLGLVRLRVKKASEEMSKLFDQVARKAASRQGPSILSEITDADIDNLFND